ncbi:hypothetical protein EVG20_g4030 [Dentipellis fragilis]|uniref:PIN domain-like protein n=1 Tax=Dentipellis fragilis TaxID=205917 RepID=A0A4Y9Z1C8_9AGAM|nr:hypothetical protein EVG20_g4030 [Dentipellis fragilis]
MGVKSLWELLKPVGRPVPLETMEGKTMAIDSSIWIYQFQATMRDKEGRALVNAHVLGFLRRICKLLFYGIKPVFVFDGGAPVLKRNTISDRKKKKSGAAANHVKVAERLLAAQLRREALSHAQAQQSAKGKGKAPAGPVTIDENTVYLEDLDPNAPKTPARKAGKDSATGPSPGSSSKKNRWHDHDPYRLPEVNLEERVAEATSTRVPDPRLATEEELRNFIEEMRPEDFDVTSPAFRELPTEVQYEIIGDLRLKSRQTSYKRLQNMLKKSQTPLDFSKEQIKNLRQRNTLTQQLLITNDTIGQAHVSIPVRIASERNREYVLIKNEGAEGGWVLGIRDEGTQAKPIQIDHEEESKVAIDDEDDDMEMEEVAIPKPADVDSDLREFRRGMALAGIAKRHTPKRLGPRKMSHPKKKQKTQPLFELEEDELPRAPQPVDDEEDDPALAIAMQASLEDEEDAALRRALEASRMNIAGRPSTASTSSSASVELVEERVAEFSDGDDLYVPAGRLETALAIANAGPTPKGLSMSRHPTQYSPQSPMFGRLIGGLLSQSTRVASTAIQVSESDEDMEEVPVTPLAKAPPPLPARSTTPTMTPNVEHRRPEVMTISDSEDDMEEVTVPGELPILTKPPQVISEPLTGAELYQVPQLAKSRTQTQTVAPAPERGFSPDLELETYVTEPVQGTPVAMENSPTSSGSRSRRIAPSVQPRPSAARPAHADALSDSDGDALSGWSRSPSPEAGPSTRTDGQQMEPKPRAAEEEWDAAQEMDTHAEEGEFARFMSQVKGKDLDAMRREIDDEIKALNQQKKAAMRDSEDITQHMISQIMVMLRLFGIPYITAPMEAEAQCAALVKLGLVEGIITDDSDVFLFGGLRVFKNMFNQSKTVECFLLSDLSRELGLQQDKLIQLAYLLGSDYVEGLPGVGPVVAMELLKEFPGHDGLHKFQDWWQKVQSGRDRPEDNKSKFRQRFKKKFKDLYLPADWPNPAVRDAYYHPTVDESEEPFKWGLPDLDGLRNLFLEELGWSTSKVEELLLPIIQKMNKRNQAQALNKQGNLNEYFDVAAGGSTTYAPRKRQAYASKRLQQVVSDFRKQQRKGTFASPQPDDGSSGSEDEYQESSTSSKAKGKGKKAATTTAKKAGTARGRGRGAGQARESANGGDASETESADSSDDEFVGRDAGVGQSTSGTTSRGASAAPQTQPKPMLRPRPRPAYKGAQGSSGPAVGVAGAGGIAEENGDAGNLRNGDENTGSG